MVTVFIPKETAEGETRVAATPATVKRLVQNQFTVLIETHAGEKAFLNDSAYQAEGATIVGSAAEGFGQADLVAMVNTPTTDQVHQMKSGATIISFIYAVRSHDLVNTLKDKGINAYAMDSIPRISRAQKLDALSSQSNLAGYKAVLLAAAELPKIFPLLMTAAGTIRPAKVVIMGAGVAGLQAIATAKRLGAVVEVSDIRPAVKEQVQSLGATYIEVPSEENLETEGGYAKEASEAFLKKQAEVTRAHLVDADVIITTALIPGKPAPVLVKEDVVKDMRDGSVIVDLAAEQGGNCELTEKGQTVERHGVKIMGILNLPGTLPLNASEIYAKNILNVIEDNLNKEKQFNWNFEDEIVDQAMVVYQGDIRHAPTREAMGLGPLEKPAMAASGGNN
ncbi:MAG: Re/Si-specific NAD(P)(+) transhydrogenase subunit alpha [Vampirovibrio sp.]|nr:Re/Si-specific NAD(P)(+) transhydrogenase subunit alpha [Vampirovibrio sp.]